MIFWKRKKKQEEKDVLDLDKLLLSGSRRTIGTVPVDGGGETARPSLETADLSRGSESRGSSEVAFCSEYENNC